MNDSPPSNLRSIVAHRIVQIGLLVALMWKIRFFFFAVQVYEEIPLSDPFFPEWFRSVPLGSDLHHHCDHPGRGIPFAGRRLSH